jgi:pimeloyl-ACP methyl ester carboxylesterase
VVLAPDSITGGERVLSQPFVTEPFDRANPGWSAMGKMLADHRRGIDYLVSLPYVDRNRIAAIGHSLGGYNAFFLAAFDERVKATVVSCGFTPMGGASKPFAWARAAWFVHFPRLAPYLRAGVLPFDMHEVMALVAPRALFNYSAAQDSIFPDAGTIRAGAAQVEAVYSLLGARDRFVFRMTDGPHAFPDAIRREACDWLEKAKP